MSASVGQRLGGVDRAEAGETGALLRNSPLIWLPFRSTRLPAALVTCVAVAGEVRRARAELRCDVLVAEQRLEAVVAARLVRQQVGRGRRLAGRGLAELDRGGVRAERAALGAVHRDADVVGGLLVLEGVGVAVELRCSPASWRRTPWGGPPRCSPARRWRWTPRPRRSRPW